MKHFIHFKAISDVSNSGEKQSLACVINFKVKVNKGQKIEQALCFFSTQREISVIECFLFQVIYVNENGKH